ncbi:hypothetical protein BDR26DRAFT_4461 [Obelidium mucronatum]|nr:hypothetical protein BDR26DRAFT_4461 [Obelidium mucronatum]
MICLVVGATYAGLVFLGITYLYLRSYICSIQMIELIASAKRSREANERLIEAVILAAAATAGAGAEAGGGGNGSSAEARVTVATTPDEIQKPSKADEEELRRQKMVLFNCVLLVVMFLASYLPAVVIACMHGLRREGVPRLWVIIGESFRAADAVASPLLILHFQNDFVELSHFYFFSYTPSNINTTCCNRDMHYALLSAFQRHHQKLIKTL